MKTLSTIAESIRHYKLNAVGGFAGWSKVHCADGYRRHVPSMGFDGVGPGEVEEIIFGWLNDIGAKQELINITEFGCSVTCYLNIPDKNGDRLDIVEVFKIDDSGKVEEI